MPFHQPDSIRYYTFELLEACGITHACITRQGGLSPHPWKSLNVGGTVGDDPQRVLVNRRRSFQALGLAFDSLYDVWQVHGNEVVCAQAPRPPDVAHLRADAILTDRRGVSLFMRFADCVPIFLHDPVRQVIGLVHAGWKGTVHQIAEDAVRVMQRRYQSRPEDILAGIGPSVGAHHYQVGPEVEQQVRKTFGDDSTDLISPSPDDNTGLRVQFDLWNANKLVLERAGVRQIEIARVCTTCHTEDWYSHRGESGQTGRFGALIAL